MTVYSYEKHLAMEKLMAEMMADEDLPAGFDYVITIMSPKTPAFIGAKVFEHLEQTGNSCFDILSALTLFILFLFFFFYS